MVVPLPRLEVSEPETPGTDAPGPVLQRWEDNDGRVVATGGPSGDGWWMRWSGLATYWFGEAGNVRAEPMRPGLDPEVRDIFTRAVVPVVLLARGFEALHASAVLGPSGVIGFCGNSGTGKSTVAFAVSATGLHHFADDTVVYRVVGGQPVAASIPFPVRVDLSQHAAIPDGRRSQNIRSAPIHRIYQLRRDATLDPPQPVFVEISPESRFQVALTHAHPFDMGTPARRRAFLENLMTLAALVEIWECRFAPDLEALPSLAASIRAHASVP